MSKNGPWEDGKLIFPALVRDKKSAAIIGYKYYVLVVLDRKLIKFMHFGVLF